MKYEEIEVGESYEVSRRTEKVIAKSDEHKAVMTIDEDGDVCAWNEEDIEDFQSIKKELPESGLLVCNNGVIAYRLEGKKGFRFDEDRFENIEYLSFESNPEYWRTATPYEEAKFIKLLKQEAEKRGLGVDAKIKGHAGGLNRKDINLDSFYPHFFKTLAYNNHGRIFHNGTWAEPLTILDDVCDTIKKHLPNIVVEMTDGVVTLKQL